MPTEFIRPKGHAVRSKSLVEEFSIKIYHPYIPDHSSATKPANNRVGGVGCVDHIHYLNVESGAMPRISNDGGVIDD
jgi:hypothetical protein